MTTLNSVPAVTETMFGAFAQELIALGAKPSQLQLEAVLESKTLQDVIALDNAGVRLSGSAERALAARINMTMAYECEDASAEKHWSKCEHKDSDTLAKALRPIKAACFAAWKNHSNPSTKWARVRAYGFELSNPAPVTGDVIPADGETAEGATGTTSRTRDLYQRSVVELAKLYRALNSAENDAIIKGHARGEELQAALLHITNALEALDAPLEDDELVAFVKTLG